MYMYVHLHSTRVTNAASSNTCMIDQVHVFYTLLKANCYIGNDMTDGLVQSLTYIQRSDLVRRPKQLLASKHSLVGFHWVQTCFLLASFGLRCRHTVCLIPCALDLTPLQTKNIQRWPPIPYIYFNLKSLKIDHFHYSRVGIRHDLWTRTARIHYLILFLSK